MKIKKINIKNFRHFEKFEFNFLNENFNLVVWENGAWKTTIFDSLRILFDSNLFLAHFLNEKDFYENKEICIEVILKFDNNDDNLYIFKDCINKVDEETVDVLVWFYKENLDSRQIYFWKKSFMDEDTFENIENFEIKIYDIKKFIQVVYIDWARTEQNFYFNNSFYNRVWKYLYNENKESKLVKLDKSGLKNNEKMKKIINNSWKNKFVAYLIEIKLLHDENKNIYLDSYDNLPLSTFLNLLRLNLDGKHLTQNSIGWQYLAFTVFAIFYIKELEKKDKEEKEEEYYLILMEEPEAHLHPQMQRNLLNFIKEKFKDIDNSSLLVSTHSPNIIRSVKDIKRTILIRGEKKYKESLPSMKVKGNLLTKAIHGIRKEPRQ